MTIRQVVLLAACLASFLIPRAAHAVTQTGSVVIEVIDPDGKAIKGATITLGSDKLQGTQIQESDERGKARFMQLPPGVYVADLFADGFASARQQIDVGLGAATARTITLAVGTAAETVTVTANPVFDATRTRTGGTFSAEDLDNLQLGSGNRSYLSAAGHLPGVVGGGGNPQIHGSTIGENNYLIDGINTTDPTTGTFGVNTNMDAIEELEILTGGFQAEYGMATGGVINQITKSGGDITHGSFDIRWYDEGLIGNAAHFDEDAPQTFRNTDFTLGGPMVKGKLWGFMAISDNLTQIRPAGAAESREFEGQSYLGKITWQVNQDHRLAFQYRKDPASIVGDNVGPLAAKEATEHQDQGGGFWTANYWGRLTDHWALTAQLGIYRGNLDAFPEYDSGLPAVTNFFTGYEYQNHGNEQYSTRQRDQFRIDADRAWTGKSGDHAVKFGIELQSSFFKSQHVTPGGEFWQSDGDSLGTDADGDTFADNIMIRQVVTDAPTSRNDGEVFSAYVQDTWQPTKRVTLDLGLRYDKSTADRDDGKRIVDVSLIQPRLGAAFDLRGNGVHALRTSLTRSMHPGILTVPAVAATRSAQSDYYYNENYFGDFNGNGVNDGLTFAGSAGGGASGSKVDEDLDAMYVDSFILGYQLKLGEHGVFGANFIANDTKDIIEDTEFPETSGSYLITNLDGLHRKYRALELTHSWVHGRWHLNANWTYSKAQGNVDYTQGVGTDFDFLPQHSVNRDGYLPQDRRHRIKIYGFVELPRKWQVGWDIFHGSGAPYNRMLPLSGFDDLGRNQYGEEYLDPRGSHRLSPITTIDGEVRKSFTYGKDNYVTLIGTITNLFGANAVTAVQEFDTGDWGAPLAWQDPRTLELGLRMGW